MWHDTQVWLPGWLIDLPWGPGWSLIEPPNGLGTLTSRMACCCCGAVAAATGTLLFGLGAATVPFGTFPPPWRRLMRAFATLALLFGPLALAFILGWGCWGGGGGGCCWGAFPRRYANAIIWSEETCCCCCCCWGAGAPVKDWANICKIFWGWAAAWQLLLLEGAGAPPNGDVPLVLFPPRSCCKFDNRFGSSLCCCCWFCWFAGGCRVWAGAGAWLLQSPWRKENWDDPPGWLPCCCCGAKVPEEEEAKRVRAKQSWDKSSREGRTKRS